MLAELTLYGFAFVADFADDGRKIQLEVIAAGPERAALTEVPGIGAGDFSERRFRFFPQVEYLMHAAVLVGFPSDGDRRARGAMGAGSDQWKRQDSIEAQVAQCEIPAARKAAQNDRPCFRDRHSEL